MIMSLNGRAVYCHLQLHSIVNPDCSHLGLIKTSLMTKETSWHGYIDPQLHVIARATYCEINTTVIYIYKCMYRHMDLPVFFID